MQKNETRPQRGHSTKINSKWIKDFVRMETLKLLKENKKILQNIGMDFLEKTSEVQQK
jgi:hypothetical protein